MSEDLNKNQKYQATIDWESWFDATLALSRARGCGYTLTVILYL